MTNRNKSVLELNTQITKQLQNCNQHKVTVDPVYFKLQSDRTYLGRYYELFMLMYRSGCRVSEALNVQHFHISANCQVLIKGLKRSHDRVVYVEECRSLFLKCSKNAENPFEHLNRFTAYRLLKSLGISKLKRGRQRESVTHLFRDNHVKDVRTSNANEVTTSLNVGHKSQKSTAFYGKD